MSKGKVKIATVEIEVDTTELDAAIEKANQLVETLGQARNLIDSLSEKGSNILSIRLSSDANSDDLIKEYDELTKSKNVVGSGA